jgi:hypothetical protein
MGNFKRANVYEFPLRDPDDARNVVIQAIFREQSLQFRAIHRGTIDWQAVPAGLQGKPYEALLINGPTFYSGKLREAPAGSAKHTYAMLIDALCREEVLGQAAEDAVWQLFWDLVLAPRGKYDFVDHLGNEWLSGLRADARNSSPATS